MEEEKICYITNRQNNNFAILKWLVSDGALVKNGDWILEADFSQIGGKVDKHTLTATKTGKLLWIANEGQRVPYGEAYVIIFTATTEGYTFKYDSIFTMKLNHDNAIIVNRFVTDGTIVDAGQKIMEITFDYNAQNLIILAKQSGKIFWTVKEKEFLKEGTIFAKILTQKIEDPKKELSAADSQVMLKTPIKQETHYTKKELDLVKNELDKTIKELNEAKAEVGISKKEFDTIKSQLINEFISENLLLNNEDGRSNHSYDRTLFDEMTSRLNMIERERDNLQQQKYISELHQWVNEAKRHADEAKTQREWQSAEHSQYKAEIYQVKTDFDSKLREEELKRDREELKREKQDIKIEKVATQFDVQRQQMMVDFGRMQNELSAVGLSLKDFVMQKVFEFKTYEMNVKEHILKMGDMINWVNAKSLETERSKIQVMEGLAQMGLALKEHETYLERTLLGADRLKLDADRQNLLNERQSNEVVLMMEKFNLEYGSKRNELENLILQVKEGQFNNHAKSSMMEMDAKVLDIQTQLKGLAFEQVGMDVFFREGQMRLSEKEGQIAMKKLQIEQNVNELKYLRQVDRLENQVETEKLKFTQRESRLQDEIGHLQSQVDKESMRSEYLRQTMRFLNTRY